MRAAYAAMAAALVSGTAGGQTTVELTTPAEATIFADGTAIGFGQVFVGQSGNGQIRRGLVRFDLASLPAGEVTSATITALVINQRGAAPLRIHRVLRAWNEGPSAGGGSAGGTGVTFGPTDATWTGTGLGTFWTTPGGDFAPVETDAQTSIGAGLAVQFDVTADVAAFADGSADNFGWIVVSDLEAVPRNVVGFSTDDEGLPTISLEVTIAEDEPCRADTNGDGLVTPADFNAWIQAFNTQSAACDQNGDMLCTPADFNAWIQNFNAGCP